MSCAEDIKNISEKNITRCLYGNYHCAECWSRDMSCMMILQTLLFCRTDMNNEIRYQEKLSSNIVGSNNQKQVIVGKEKWPLI